MSIRTKVLYTILSFLTLSHALFSDLADFRGPNLQTLSRGANFSFTGTSLVGFNSFQNPLKDIDGDQKPEIAVYSAHPTRKIFIFLSSSFLNSRTRDVPISSADFSFTLNLPTATLVKVYSIGNIGGDSRSDILISDNGGKHYIFLSSNLIDASSRRPRSREIDLSTADFTLTPPYRVSDTMRDNNFWERAISHGDIDGDHYDDILIAEDLAGHEDVPPQKVLLLILSSRLRNLSAQEIPYSSVFELTTRAINFSENQFIPDVNGDHQSDIIVRTFYRDRIVDYLLLSSTVTRLRESHVNLETSADYAFTQRDNRVQDSYPSVYHLIACADIDGDSRSDLFLTSEIMDGEATDGFKKIYFIRGSTLRESNRGYFNLSTGADKTIIAHPDLASSAQRIFSIYNAGDVTGDGISDILLGPSELFDEGPSPNLHAAYLISGERFRSTSHLPIDIMSSDYYFTPVNIDISVSSVLPPNVILPPDIDPNDLHVLTFYNGMSDIQTADFDGDGRSDILIRLNYDYIIPEFQMGIALRNENPTRTYIILSRNLSAIQDIPLQRTEYVIPNSVKVVEDLDGDHLKDIFTYEVNNHTTAHLIFTNQIFRDTPPIYQIPWEYLILNLPFPPKPEPEPWPEKKEAINLLEDKIQNSREEQIQENIQDKTSKSNALTKTGDKHEN